MRLLLPPPRAALLLALAGCAHDVVAHYPLAAAPASGPTGTLVLQLSKAASDVSVAIDGVLVVDAAHTGHVVIDRVPIGTAEIVMTANGADKDFHIWVGGDHPTTVPLGVADHAPNFLETLAGTLITLVAYTLLHS